MDNFIFCNPIVIISPQSNKTSLDEYVIMPDYCVLKNLLTDYVNSIECNHNEVEAVDVFGHNRLAGIDDEAKAISVLNSLKEKPLTKIKFKIDILIFSLFMFELQRSKTFRHNVLKRFYRYSYKSLKSKRLQSGALCNKTQRLLQVNAHLTDTKVNTIDYRWNKKLEVLINERCELDNAMAWLSTLGGAFSALGDYFVDCAEKAGLISIHQLRLALRIGDPITICQCKIYLAMSLLQRGYYSKTKNLIRESYMFATGPEGSKDFRIKNMCIAVWNKLKYTLSEGRKKGKTKVF